MTILKYLILFLAVYFISNVAYWGYQEYVNYDDMQTVRSLGNTINITRVNIEELEQDIERKRKDVDAKKEQLDGLLLEKKYTQYNELVLDYNQSVDSMNKLVLEYENIIITYNSNIKQINDLLIKSGTRHYIFPISSYEPELYKEI